MKKKTKKNKMTLDKLATVVQGEFLQVGKRFDNLENRFDNLEERFDNLENRFDNLENGVKDGFSRVDARLGMIERDIKSFVEYDEFEDLMARVKYLEQKLGIESGK